MEIQITESRICGGINPHMKRLRRCPKRQQPSVKRIQIPIKSLKKLKRNEVMASVSGVHVPTTIDSGADRALIPEELVQPDQFTGMVEAFNGVAQGTLQGKIAKVVFRIAGVDYSREALAVPGEQIFWTAALSLDPNNMEQVDHLFGQVRKNTHLSEEDSHYMPPRMMDGKVQGAVTVSEGTLVGAEEPTHSVTVDPEFRSEET